MKTQSTAGKVALITGASRRVGKAITLALHEAGYQVAIHYRNHKAEAQQLADELNQNRQDSAMLVSGDLCDGNTPAHLVTQVTDHWGRLDALVNNASSFYQTPFGDCEQSQWDDLFGSNVRGAFFLTQCAAPWLKKSHGAVVNITDIHSQFPMKHYPIYTMAKAALTMMTKSLSQALGPEVRVNGVAPGTVAWPEGDNELAETLQNTLVEKTFLKRHGEPQDAAEVVLFLLTGAHYVTGQILPVDGGRSLHI